MIPTPPNLVDYTELMDAGEKEKYLAASRWLVDAQPFQTFLRGFDPEEKEKGSRDLKSIVPQVKKKAPPEMPSVFISYSHKDAAYQDQLVTHLSALKRLGRIEAWDDTHIRPEQGPVPTGSAGREGGRKSEI